MMLTRATRAQNRADPVRALRVLVGFRAAGSPEPTVTLEVAT